MISKKKAQIQVTFNWLYILIAGAVILLFFIGIVVKQKAASEEQLTYDVTRVMESIFNAAGVSEKTKNFVDTSGLADYTLVFTCDDGMTEFGVKGSSGLRQNNVDPIFSFNEIRSPKLVLWSYPYYLPFKVIDLLFITSTNTKFRLVGNDINFVDDFLNSTEGLDTKYLPAGLDAENFSLAGNSYLRVVDLDGNLGNYPLPPSIANIKDEKVSMVSFPSSGEVNFYVKEDDSWKQLNDEPIRMIALTDYGERNAAKYAAIFSGNPQIYNCNMKKAFLRLEMMVEIYQGKLGEMLSYYSGDPLLKAGGCFPYMQPRGDSVNLKTALDQLTSNVVMCVDLNEGCLDLITAANDLAEANENLHKEGDCLTLY